LQVFQEAPALESNLCSLDINLVDLVFKEYYWKPSFYFNLLNTLNVFKYILPDKYQVWVGLEKDCKSYDKVM